MSFTFRPVDKWDIFSEPGNGLLGPTIAITPQASPYVLLLFLSFFLSFFIQRDISAVSRPIRRRAKLCHMIGNGCNFKKTRSKIRGSSPKKLGPKNTLFGAISDDFALRSWISPESGTEQDIDNRKTAFQSWNYDLSRVCWRNLVNFEWPCLANAPQRGLGDSNIFGGIKNILCVG